MQDQESSTEAGLIDRLAACQTLAGLPPGPWWSMVLSWWVLYTLCGLLLGA